MTSDRQKKILYLMRHGEALHTASHDHMRRLSQKGKADSRYIGAQIMAHIGQPAMRPRILLASSAMRTRETAQNLAITPPPQLHISERLYHGSAQDYLDEIRLHDSGSLMIIGHNPSISQLLHFLCRNADAHDLPPSFPPAALAILEFSAPFHECSAHQGQLRAFIAP